MSQPHKAGFVSIVGRPNVGKSTLMNRLVGENLSIVTLKAQTTRHRIMGILSADDFQIVYSDTPGLLEPQYELHKAMMNYVKVSLEDADVVLLVVEAGESYHEKAFGRLKNLQVPLVLLINKLDQTTKVLMEEKAVHWKEHLHPAEVLTISALNGTNVDRVLPVVLKHLPEHPAFFPKDDLTTRSERFFASEILREKIFMNYGQEVPYSAEVGIESFKDEEGIIRIRAIIYVERDSQKGILIGKGGSALKKVGTEARQDLETFFGKKIFLETHVKVAGNWRKEKEKLKHFGYFE